jgi:hypothetical protein
MAQRQTAISINIIETDPVEVLLAKYLRSQGKIKSYLLDAAQAFWYPLAVSDNPLASNVDKELATIKSITALSAQIAYIIEHDRIKNGITYSTETLQRCGLMAITMPHQTKINPTDKKIEREDIKTVIRSDSTDTDSDNDWGNEY